MNLKKVTEEITHYLYPNCCSYCNIKLLSKEKSICLHCLYKLPRANSFNEPNNPIATILAGRFPFEHATSFSFFTKGGMLQTLIHQLKYKNKPHIGYLLGVLFGKDLIGSKFIASIDIIVPVPLHRKKQKARGYNQAEVIAQGISYATSIPISKDNLVRVIDTPTQTKQSKTERWENVHDIFYVNNRDAFQNKHILLIDDVITTGSTLEACAVALTKCENTKISVATIASAS